MRVVPILAVLVVRVSVALAAAPIGNLHVSLTGKGSTSSNETSTPARQGSDMLSWSADSDVNLDQLLFVGFPHRGSINLSATLTGQGTFTWGTVSCAGAVSFTDTDRQQAGLVSIELDQSPTMETLHTGFLMRQVPLDAGAFTDANGTDCGNYRPLVSGFPNQLVDSVTTVKVAIDLDEIERLGKKEIVLEPSDTAVTGDTTTSAQLKETITLTWPTAPPPKSQALLDGLREQIRRVLSQAVAPCLVAGAGVGVILSNGPAIGVIVGGTMVGASAPLCALLVKELRDLLDAYDDPPDPAFGHVVRVRAAARRALDLPPCTSLAPADRRLCKRLERAATRFVARVARGGAVATAVDTTVSRLGAATAANDAKAAKRQQRALDKRLKQLDAAAGARAKAGATFAAALRDAGATGILSVDQAAQAIDLVLGRVVAQGIAESAARAVLGPALTPQATDALAVLAQP